VARRDTETAGQSEEEGRDRSPLERPIALFAPLLDLLLWAGDRVSRIAGPVDHEHYPVRPPDREDGDDVAVERQDDR
jgi:hypothetical protein